MIETEGYKSGPGVEPRVEPAEDPALLKVSGKRDNEADRETVQKLANAISRVVSRHGVARLRCVGAAAVNNAEKAFIVAAGKAMTSGQELVAKSHFSTVNFDGEEKTAIVKEVFPR